MSERITVLENIFTANDILADENRSILDKSRVFSINIIASPGAGKTSLVENTIGMLKDRFRIAVIDGDIATTLDADRASAAGAEAVQINTGGECHIDANMIRDALMHIKLDETDLLIVENVGNLVCPANFRLGTHRNILVASLPEGDDKPYKYPGTYEAMDVILLNKIDLLPYVSFRLDYFMHGARALNPDGILFTVSCTNKTGLDAWTEWLANQIIKSRTLFETTG